MALRIGSRVAIATGDFVTIDEEVCIEKFETKLRISANSVGRYVRQAWDPGYAVVLLGTWHMRVPRRSISYLRSSGEPLPFPWTDNVIKKSLKWGLK